jgi:branched-chain amino acid aminotransferase
MTVWLNGALTTQPVIDPSDRGFTLGDGLFETIRAVGGRGLHLRRHWRRLRAGAAVLEIMMPFSDASLSSAVRSLLESETGEKTVRLTLTRGPAMRGLLPTPNAASTPTVLITTAPPVPLQSAATLMVAGITRRNEYSPLARIKTLSTLDALLARQEATRAGVDDAILLNSQGRVAEASSSNLFFLFGEEIVTPPVTEGALPGIRRELALERLPVVERPVLVEEALAADDILLTSSLSLRAAASLQGRKLPRSGELLGRFAQLL